MAQGLTPESPRADPRADLHASDALEKINEEMDGLTDTLEEIHIASEAQNAAEVKRYGNEYLETARKVIK